jgi:signal peptidase I
MEPAFHRGDLLMLTNDRSDPIRAGDITVFKIEGRDIPIVHRVIKVHEKSNNEDSKFLTKGDHNQVDDRGLYAPVSALFWDAKTLFRDNIGLPLKMLLVVAKALSHTLEWSQSS